MYYALLVVFPTVTCCVCQHSIKALLTYLLMLVVRTAQLTCSVHVGCRLIFSSINRSRSNGIKRFDLVTVSFRPSYISFSYVLSVENAYLDRRKERQPVFARQDIYTVGHKKRGSKLLSITLAKLNQF